MMPHQFHSLEGNQLTCSNVLDTTILNPLLDKFIYNYIHINWYWQDRYTTSAVFRPKVV